MNSGTGSAATGSRRAGNSGHAVVVGGSIAGLTAARVLSDRFGRVTVLDRDTLPADGRTRGGVPQGGHAHALLIRGRLALEELFPELTAELVAGGAVPFDPGRDMLFSQLGALRTRFASGLLAVSVSRGFLEYAMRRRVTALPGVRLRDQVSAVGLTGGPERVDGVRLHGGEVLAADLVVDATGRGGARTDRWLAELGCPAPAVTSVRIDVGYTTRLLRRRPDDLPDGALLYLIATPPHDKRAAAVAPIEGDRWMVTLGGYHHRHAPTDPAGFAAFADGLPDPYLAALIAKAEPVGDGAAHHFRYPTARRRRFERLRRVPAGYVAVGDTICSFNPLYGQGMTLAILEAIELGRCLDRAGAASAAMVRDYYRAAGKLVDTPWQLAISSDFVYPETTGPKRPGTDLFNRYGREVVLATHTSPEVHRVMLEIQNMLAPPSLILRPGTVLRALRAARHSPVRRADRSHRDAPPS